MASISTSSNGTQHLRVGIELANCGFQWPRYVNAHRNADGTVEYTGFCMDLLNIIAQTLNFSYSLVRPPDGHWGNKVHGNWTGLMRLLQRKEVDMVTYLAPSAERSQVADWSLPYDNWYNGLAVKRDIGNPALDIFLGPLHWKVYVCVMLAFICFTSLLCGVDIAEQYLSPAWHQRSSVPDIVQSVYGMLLNKAAHHQWTGIRRGLLAAWCVLALVLTSCYTSKLTSLLMDVPAPPPFTSLAEMVSRGDFKWGTVGGTKLLSIFRNSTNAVEKAVYQGLMRFAESDPDVLSGVSKVHLDKVLKGSYAFIGEGATVESWASQHCEITVLPQRLTGLEFYSIAVPRFSPLKRQLDLIILRLQSSGILSQLRSHWFPSPRSCLRTLSPSKAISLTTLQGPFYVALGGLMLATCTLLLERFIQRYRTRMSSSSHC